MGNPIKLSVVIPVSERYDNVKSVYSAYRDALKSTGITHEFVYVLDGDYPDVLSELGNLNEADENIKIVKLARSFGEATALTAGFEHTSGELIMTLPAYLQILPAEITKLIEYAGDYDMLVARRWPRSDSLANRIQSRLFHLPIRLLTGLNYSDLGCSVRLMKRKVTEELHIYGDQHRFLPLLAFKQGFRVIEVDAAQAHEDTKRRLYSPGIYLRRLLDIVSVFFLLKFTKKPMRFFGLLGSSVFGIGSIVLLIAAIQRIFWSIPLADRPILLLGSLLVVLGIQIFAIGLVGEIIIFTHAKDMKEYTVEEVVN